MTEERSPSLFDYFAAAVLANSVVYAWTYAATEMPLLYVLNVLVFAAAGGFPCWFVCRRASKNFLLVGLRVGLVGWALTAFMISTLAEGVDLTYLVVLFACMMLGALAVAYSRQREKIREKSKGEPSDQKTEYP